MIVSTFSHQKSVGGKGWLTDLDNKIMMMVFVEQSVPGFPGSAKYIEL